jgi:Spy/CpxP family protein refolding chaperone
VTHRSAIIALFSGLLIFATLANATDDSQSSKEKCAVSTLSDQEIRDHLSGSGAGDMQTADSHHYPGPMHILGNAEHLNLTAEQAAKAHEIYQAMSDERVRIGKEILQKESELEALFVQQKATEENTGKLIADLTQLQAASRLAHLKAHLRMRAVLSEKQLAQYDQLHDDHPQASAQEAQHH